MAKQTITISVLADTKKFSSAMRDVGKATGLGKLGGAAKTAGKFVLGAGAAVVGLGATVATLGLKGGFERALNIEDAKAQLRGLGHDTKVIDQVMNDALASVKGTSFGLGDAATIGANAVAAGIKPGKDLERQLRLVADSGALAKTDLNEMGAIFTKVWTSGRVGTQELNQLADRGIPIWTALADSYGVSAEELRKMVSAGKVDAETFATVMEETVGGSALSMGDTTRGAWKNMMAALSRAGERFLSGVFPLFKTGIQGITGAFDSVAPYAERAGQALGAWVTETAIPAVEAFIPRLQAMVGEIRDQAVPVAQQLWTTWTTQVLPALREAGEFIVTTLVPAVQNLATFLRENSDTVTALSIAVGTAVTSFLAWQRVALVLTTVKAALTTGVLLFNAALKANPIGAVIAVVAALAAGLYYFFTQTETGKALWDRIWPAIQAVVEAVVTWFTDTALPALQGFWDGLSAAASTVVTWFTTTALPALRRFWEQVSAKATEVAGWFRTHVWPVIQAAIDLVMAIFARMSDRFTTAVGAVRSVWDRIGGPVMATIRTVIRGLSDYWKVTWQAISGVVQTVWRVMKSIIEAALGVIRGVINTVTGIISGDWSRVWNGIKTIASSIWNGIKGVISGLIGGIRDTISGVLNAIVGIVSARFGSARDTASRIWNGIRTTLTGIVEGIRANVASKIQAVLNFLSAAWNIARTAVGTAWQGIRTVIADRITSVLDLVRNLPGRLVRSLGNMGRVLYQSGRDLVTGLLNGVGSLAATIGSWFINKLPGWIQWPFKKALGIASPSKVFAGYGRNIGQGVIVGLDGMRTRVSRTTSALAGTVTDAWNDPQLQLAGGAAGRASTAHTGGVHITVNAQMLEPTPDAGRRIAETVGDYLRLNGNR